MERADQTMDRVESTSSGLRSQIHALEGAFLVAGAAAAGLAVSLGLMTRRYGQVDQTFAQIQENTQASAEQMEAMRAEALQVGAELPTTLRDSADTLRELTKAGFEAEEATEALSGTTYLAIAGQLEMARAAEISANALNAWGLDADKAGAVANTLAVTAASASTEITEMGEAFRYASSSASQLGVSSQELSALVGVLSDVGMQGSIAGTSINRALLSIIDPTDKAREALASAGISMDDFTNKNGELKEMSDILNLLNKRTSEMSQVQRQAMLAEAFGTRGARAIGPAIDNMEKYNELLADTSRAQVAGGISQLGDLSQDDLDERQQAVGFNLQPGSTRDVLEQFRSMAQKEGLNQQELATQIQLGLNVNEDAARLLSGDLLGGTDMGKLVNGIESVSTAQQKAEASMQTFRGQVEQFTGAMDTFFYRVYSGATGPLSLLFDILNPLADLLAGNRTAANILGVALVGAAGAASVAAVAIGAMYAEVLIAESSFMAAAASTQTYSAAQWGLAAASKAASGAVWLMTASLADVRTALATSQAAQWASSASTWTLSGAYATLTGAVGTATGALYGFWTALGPIGWVILGIIGLFAAWKSGLLDFIGLGPEVDAVISGISWAVGGLADVLGGVGDATGGAVGWLLKFAGVLLKVSFFPFVLSIKILVDLIRAFGYGISSIVDTGQTLLDFFSNSNSSAEALGRALGILLGDTDAFKTALKSIPGMGLVFWLLEVVNNIESIGDAFQKAIEAGKEFMDWLNPASKGQSLGDWANPLPDSPRGEPGDSQQQQQGQTQNQVSAVNSPNFNMSVVMDGLQSALQQGHDESSNELRKQLETELYQYQNGQ